MIWHGPGISWDIRWGSCYNSITHSGGTSEEQLIPVLQFSIIQFLFTKGLKKEGKMGRSLLFQLEAIMAGLWRKGRCFQDLSPKVGMARLCFHTSKKGSLTPWLLPLTD